MTTEERLRGLFASPEPGKALRSLILELSRTGQTRAELYDLLERFLLEMRQREGHREADEETVLDAMDSLSGWCHPQGQLLADDQPGGCSSEPGPPDGR